MNFACLFTANIHYGLFGKLQEGPLPTLQITTGSVIATHYSKYSKILEGLKDQLMLDNDKIVGDAGDVREKKAGSDNKRGDQEDAEVGIDEKGDGRDQEVGKVGYDRVGDRVDIGRVSKDVKVGNNDVGDSAIN